MKINIKKIIKTSSLFVTAIIATIIIISNNNIKSAKAEETTVETYTIMSGNMFGLNGNALTQDEYAALSIKSKTERVNSNVFLQMTGYLQMTRIGQQISFNYYDKNTNKNTVIGFETYLGYPKPNERIIMMGKNIIPWITTNSNGELERVNEKAGSIILEINAMNTERTSEDRAYNTIKIKPNFSTIPIKTYSDFKNQIYTTLFFQDFEIKIYVTLGTKWTTQTTTYPEVTAYAEKSFQTENAITQASEITNQQQYELGYQSGNANKEAYGQNKYQTGYAEGLQAGGSYTFENLILSVIDAPISTVYGLLNFDILGTNMFSFVIALISIVIVIKIIQIVIGRL